MRGIDYVLIEANYKVTAAESSNWDRSHESISVLASKQIYSALYEEVTHKTATKEKNRPH
jgi:hypothetical protein